MDGFPLTALPVTMSTVTSSFAVPQPPTRRATLDLRTNLGVFGVEVGGIWGGSTKVGDGFQIAEKDGDDYRLLQDYVKDADTFGAKHVGQNYGWVFLAYGVGGIFGPILGAVVFVFFAFALSEYTPAWHLYLGVFFVLLVMFAPGGLSSRAVARGRSYTRIQSVSADLRRGRRPRSLRALYKSS